MILEKAQGIQYVVHLTQIDLLALGILIAQLQGVLIVQEGVLEQAQDIQREVCIAL